MSEEHGTRSLVTVVDVLIITLMMNILQTLAEVLKQLQQLQMAGVRKTVTIERRDILVSGPVGLLYQEGSGSLDEMVIISNSLDYYVTVIADDSGVISGRAGDLREPAQYLESIAVMQNNSGYVFYLRNISFKQKIVVTVEPAGQVQTSISRFFAKLSLA